MKNILKVIAAAVFAGIVPLFSANGQPVSADGFPVEVCASGGMNHVQGIAFDKEAGRMYFSFTTSFVVTDLSGKVIGSIEKIQGHLGAMVFNPEDRKVYESLECKDDEIGKGLSDFAKGRSLFYIAIIDVDKIDRIGIDVEDNDIFKTVCIKEAVKDYHASALLQEGKVVEHRYGCSGIDGVAIAPEFGKPGGRNYLYVGYGIYGDVERSDNDCQILLRYDMKKLNAMARTVRFGEFDETGPDKPLDKIFVETGNTVYGIQNMAYDPSRNSLFLAVYRGQKTEFRNYSLFEVNMDVRPEKVSLQAKIPYDRKKRRYVPDVWNVNDSAGAERKGWNFKWGSTGICCAGDGLWYFSENYKDSVTGLQGCKAHLYRWTGGEIPFERL